jgi:hypothetical protein
MKIPIDQYEPKLHGRIFGLFVAAMLVVAAIAWLIDGTYGKDWHRQLIEYFDTFWPKAADEAKLIGLIGMPTLVGPYLLAQATFSVFMIFVAVWFIVEMHRVADFSQPRKLVLQPDFLIFSPIVVGLIFGGVYFYNGFNGTTRFSRTIFGTPVLLLWVPLSYAAVSIICIQIAAAYFVRLEQKTTNGSPN